MTHRERWTVYPLLFLSLGVALRDKIAPTFEAEQIRCRAIAVTDAEGDEVLSMQGDPQGGRLAVLDAAGRQIAILGGGSGGAVVSRLQAEAVVCRDLAVTNPQDKRVLHLGALDDRSGFVELHDAQSDLPLVRLGRGQHGGLILKYNEIGLPILLHSSEAGLDEPDDEAPDDASGEPISDERPDRRQ